MTPGCSEIRGFMTLHGMRQVTSMCTESWTRGFIVQGPAWCPRPTALATPDDCRRALLRMTRSCLVLGDAPLAGRNQKAQHFERLLLRVGTLTAPRRCTPSPPGHWGLPLGSGLEPDSRRPAGPSVQSLLRSILLPSPSRGTLALSPPPGTSWSPHPLVWPPPSLPPSPPRVWTLQEPPTEPVGVGLL